MRRIKSDLPLLIIASSIPTLAAAALSAVSPLLLSPFSFTNPLGRVEMKEEFLVAKEAKSGPLVIVGLGYLFPSEATKKEQ